MEWLLLSSLYHCYCTINTTIIGHRPTYWESGSCEPVTLIVPRSLRLYLDALIMPGYIRVTTWYTREVCASSQHQRYRRGGSPDTWSNANLNCHRDFINILLIKNLAFSLICLRVHCTSNEYFSRWGGDRSQVIVGAFTEVEACIFPVCLFQCNSTCYRGSLMNSHEYSVMFVWK